MYFETLTFVGVLVGSVALLIGGTVLLSELCNKIKGKKEVEEPVEEAPYKLEPAEDHKCDCEGACGDNCKCKITTESIDSEAITAEPIASETIDVYVNGGSSSSNKYHATPDAHGMDGAIPMSIQEAKAQGYEPCSKCFK